MSEGGEGLVEPEHPRALRHRGAEEAGTHTHTHTHTLLSASPKEGLAECAKHNGVSGVGG